MSTLTAFGLFCFAAIFSIAVITIVTDFIADFFELSSVVAMFIFGAMLSLLIAVVGFIPF